MQRLENSLVRVSLYAVLLNRLSAHQVETQEATVEHVSNINCLIVSFHFTLVKIKPRIDAAVGFIHR